MVRRRNNYLKILSALFTLEGPVTPSILSRGSLDALARTTTTNVHALESCGRIGTIAAISTFWAAGRSELYLGASGREEPNV